ncbi:CaiB/BaiF CoA transferase family protein [Pseudorhodoferax sp.]|uniref:CaiB/BaiF CoA transferase family protein n=1 Tax=Pseudorhodoferax sp. TaxID=1993553 RepID=UPI0039E59971
MPDSFPIANRGPLEGVVVLDFTTQLSGPLATYLLASMGATVLKIEEPGGDTVRSYAPFVNPDGTLSMWQEHPDAMSLPILNRSRGKHGITLNLKAPEAREIYRALASRADVVIENFASGTADRIGIGYEATRAINPRIVYCSLSGFGCDGMGDRKAFDVVIQAMSGIAMASGADGGPPVRVGMPIADMVAPLFAVTGITAALHRRHATGAGEYVDVSMLGSLTALLAVEDWQAMERVGTPTRTGNHLLRATPFGLFACRDGDIAIGAGARDPFAHALFRLMGQPGMCSDPRYATLPARCQHQQDLNDLVGTWCAGRSADEVERELLAAGIPAAKVRTPAQAVQEPLLGRRREIMDVEHPDLGVVPGLKTMGLPIRFHQAEYGHGAAAPRLGEHNAAVYGRWLGIDEDTLSAWKAAGVF